MGSLVVFTRRFFERQEDCSFCWTGVLVEEESEECAEPEEDRGKDAWEEIGESLEEFCSSEVWFEVLQRMDWVE